MEETISYNILICVDIYQWNHARYCLIETNGDVVTHDAQSPHI